MSAHYRTTINLVHPEAAEIANNTKDFPVPARPQGQSDLIFSQQIRSLIQELDEEATDVRDFISQLSDASDRWMTLRTSMTGNERTQDNTSYDEFIAATPFPQTLNNLKKYDRSLRTQRRKLETAIPQNNPTNTNNTNSPNSSVIHLPKTELPKFSGNCIEYQSFGIHLSLVFMICPFPIPLNLRI
ncbi:hypothetical protein niasHT_020401 [Heterodera trifolii]|uniref:Uncharacterized protein n=1 Tax=Heterodera trifolii TaxID=157864 RepID=A0ABD2JX83_9BILA